MNIHNDQPPFLLNSKLRDINPDARFEVQPLCFKPYFSKYKRPRLISYKKQHSTKIRPKSNQATDHLSVFISRPSLDDLIVQRIVQLFKPQQNIVTCKNSNNRFLKVYANHGLNIHWTNQRTINHQFNVNPFQQTPFLLKICFWCFWSNPFFYFLELKDFFFQLLSFFDSFSTSFDSSTGALTSSGFLSFSRGKNLIVSFIFFYTIGTKTRQFKLLDK